MVGMVGGSHSEDVGDDEAERGREMEKATKHARKKETIFIKPMGGIAGKGGKSGGAVDPPAGGMINPRYGIQTQRMHRCIYGCMDMDMWIHIPYTHSCIGDTYTHPHTIRTYPRTYTHT